MFTVIHKLQEVLNQIKGSDNVEYVITRSNQDKLTVRGSFWSAGDNIYVDVWTPEEGWKCVCINDLMKEHIPENCLIEIEITLLEND